MRLRSLLLSLLAAPALAQGADSVRSELEAQYRRNADAFERRDIDAIMALRAPDFFTIGADGTRQNRTGMRLRTISFLNGVQKWNTQSVTIDSLSLAGDTAFAIVSQYLDRMALLQDGVHRVETWVTQRETWILQSGGWLLWRVDQLRKQRRAIDGVPRHDGPTGFSARH